MQTHGRVSSKGQLVIPAELRKNLGIKNGTSVIIREENGTMVVEPLHLLLNRLHGCLKGKPSASEYLLAERRKDRQL